MIGALNRMIREAGKTVFFGGAGVSTESDIPDFRSSAGLYTRLGERYANPKEIFSHAFFVNHTAEFYRILRGEVMAPRPLPNRAHHALARMERDGVLHSVITQNTDGLHQKAGSVRVCELHGSSHRNPCTACGEVYDRDFILNAPGPVPLCARCGGVVRLGVVLFGEALLKDVLEQSIEAVEAADLFIVGGTSLRVQPAAGLLRRFSGKSLVIINREPTQYDDRADLVFRESIGGVLQAAWPG
jgi:NAD-dependent deacetylase